MRPKIGIPERGYKSLSCALPVISNSFYEKKNNNSCGYHKAGDHFLSLQIYRWLSKPPTPFWVCSIPLLVIEVPLQLVIEICQTSLEGSYFSSSLWKVLHAKEREGVCLCCLLLLIGTTLMKAVVQVRKAWLRCEQNWACFFHYPTPILFFEWKEPLKLAFGGGGLPSSLSKLPVII